jgi:hypothetical protein
MGSVGFDYSVFFFVRIREIIRDGSRHPNAVLSFAKGDRSDDQIQAAAEAWGRRLLRGSASSF